MASLEPAHRRGMCRKAHPIDNCGSDKIPFPQQTGLNRLSGLQRLIETSHQQRLTIDPTPA